MTVDTRKKPSVLDRLISVFRPSRRKPADIVAQAEEVLDRYAGSKAGQLRFLRRQARHRVIIKVLNAAIFAVCGVIVFLLWKIIVP